MSMLSVKTISTMKVPFEVAMGTREMLRPGVGFAIYRMDKHPKTGAPVEALITVVNDSPRLIAVDDNQLGNWKDKGLFAYEAVLSAP